MTTRRSGGCRVRGLSGQRGPAGSVLLAPDSWSKNSTVISPPSSVALRAQASSWEGVRRLVLAVVGGQAAVEGQAEGWELTRSPPRSRRRYR